MINVTVEPKHVGRLIKFCSPYGESCYFADVVDKILANDQELILEQRDEISKLKAKVNQLRNKNG